MQQGYSTVKHGSLVSIVVGTGINLDTEYGWQK